MSNRQTVNHQLPDLPLRFKAVFVSSADQLDDVRKRVARILMLVEAAECWLFEHRGSEIDREQLLDYLDLIAEQAEAVVLPERKAATAAPVRGRMGQS